ncbi:hypothetical protein F5877DRAFT_49781, partial [Lentinula edodes]
LLLLMLLLILLYAVSVIATIASHITLMVIDTKETGELGSQLNHGINITQVAILVLSLLTNLLATFFISLKAWSIRNNLNTAVNGCSWVGKIFVLLIKMGALYSVSCVCCYPSFNMCLDGTVGDLYTPVGTQLAGIYPVVVLLISQDYILDRTVQAFASGVEIQTGFHFSGQLDTICFYHQSIADFVAGDMEENRSRDGGTTGYWNGHQRFWGIECPECMIFIICMSAKKVRRMKFCSGLGSKGKMIYI